MYKFIYPIFNMFTSVGEVEPTKKPVPEEHDGPEKEIVEKLQDISEERNNNQSTTNNNQSPSILWEDSDISFLTETLDEVQFNIDDPSELPPTPEDSDEECGDTNKKYVKVISSDGEEFIITREQARMSGKIERMLQTPGQFVDNGMYEIRLRGIRSHLLAKIFWYLDYMLRNHTKEIPYESWDEDLCDLMMAAINLEC